MFASYKTPITADVTSAITTAMKQVLEISNVPLTEVICLIIGTTSFINALVEEDRRRLKKVGILRLSKSFLREIPPFSEFPAGLSEFVMVILAALMEGSLSTGVKKFRSTRIK